MDFNLPEEKVCGKKDTVCLEEGRYRRPGLRGEERVRCDQQKGGVQYCPMRKADAPLWIEKGKGTRVCNDSDRLCASGLAD